MRNNFALLFFLKKRNECIFFGMFLFICLVTDHTQRVASLNLLFSMRIRSSFLAIFLLPSSPSHSLPSHYLTFLSILLSLRSPLCLMLNPEKTQMVNVVIRNLGLPSLEVEVGGASLLSSSLLMPSSFLRFMVLCHLNAVFKNQDREILKVSFYLFIIEIMNRVCIVHVCRIVRFRWL